MIMLGVPNIKTWGTGTPNLISGTENPIWGTVGVPVPQDGKPWVRRLVAGR